jgi:hypothetical protein
MQSGRWLLALPKEIFASILRAKVKIETVDACLMTPYSLGGGYQLFQKKFLPPSSG